MDKPAKIKQPPIQNEHTLTYNNDFGLWHCTACLNNFRKKQSATHKPCDQLAGRMLSVIVQAQENEHNVWICDMATPGNKLDFCNRCGCYAQVQAKDLLRRCKATAGGQRSRLVTCIQQEKHPTTGALLGKPRLVPFCTESPKDKGRSRHKAKLEEEGMKADQGQRTQGSSKPTPHFVQKPVTMKLVEKGSKADQGHSTQESSIPLPHFGNEPELPVEFEGHFEEPPVDNEDNLDEPQELLELGFMSMDAE